jgi:ankyrin repeat protein
VEVDDLREILLGAPGEAAAESAALVLLGLAGAGDRAATVALVRALAHELGQGDDMPGLEAARSTPELLAVSSVPPLLRIYAAGWYPREFLAHAEALAQLSKAASLADEDSFAAFRRMLLRRATLQHEALKAFVLCGVAAQFGMTRAFGGGLAPGGALGILDRVSKGSRVVEGDNADASLRFGRAFILDLPGVEAFRFRIHHELGHNLLDGLRGSAPATLDHAAALREMANALPALLAEACRLRGRPFAAGDRRSVLLGSGVRLVCTHERAPHVACYLGSLTLQGGPIGLPVAAPYVHALLALTGSDLLQAALAQDPRGLFHFGFAGDAALADALPARLAQADIEAMAASALQEGTQWIEAQGRAGSIGRSAFDVLIDLGMAPRAPQYLGPDPAQTMGDRERSSALRELATVPALDERQAAAGFAAALRSADPVVLGRILASRPMPQAFLQACPLSPADVGASLHALFDRDSTRFEGPVLADIMESLRILASWQMKFDAIDAHSGDTLLARAAGKEFGLVQFLLQLGAEPDRPGREGRTPLGACALTGPLEAARALLGAGAAVDARDAEGATPLHHASQRGEAPLVDLLLAHGASADFADHDGRTPLMRTRTDAVARLLCDHGADPGLRDNAGQTALHHAALMRLDRVVAVLLAHGADAEAASHLGATPMHEAAIGGSEPCLRLLLDAGADVNEETQNGLTPLMLAVRGGRRAAVKCLLAGGADAGAQTVSGSTAVLLCICAINDESRDFSLGARVQDCLRALIDAGADVDAANDRGTTPLHAAASGFDAGLVALLLAAGARPSPRDKQGRTPLSLAKAQGHAAMVETLVQAAAVDADADAEKPQAGHDEP